jgi:uncharacterized membrane protein YedE/YeeE
MKIDVCWCGFLFLVMVRLDIQAFRYSLRGGAGLPLLVLAWLRYAVEGHG